MQSVFKALPNFRNVTSGLSALSLLSFSLVYLNAISAYSQSQDPKVVPGEYLIRFKRQLGGASQAAQKLQGKAEMKSSFPGMDMYHISMKGSSYEAVDVEALKKDPMVEFIEPNYVLDKQEVAPPEEVIPMSADEVAAQGVISTSPTTYSQSGSAQSRVSEVWPVLTPLSAQKPAIVVAVVDTGLDSAHRLFKSTSLGGAGGLWQNMAEINGRPNFDDDQNGFTDDFNGWNFIANTNNFADDDNHGTHVAGIVLGAGFNIFQSPLPESKIKIMPLKFLDASGAGSTSNAIRAIYYAVNNGAKVINNSWGGNSYSRSLHDAYIYAYDHSVVVTSAAGNYGSDNDKTPLYPANLDVPSNIAVASVSDYDQLSTFSNYGKISVPVTSPGEAIVSSIPGNQFAKMWGTSMAAPLVAGISALALREADRLSSYQVKQLVVAQSDPVANLRLKTSTESRIDALSIIQGAKNNVSVASFQPSYSPSYGSSELASSAPAPGGGCGLVVEAAKTGPGQGQSQQGPQGWVYFMLVGMPFGAFALSRRFAKANPRKFDRFKLQSEIRVQVGDKEIVGNLNTIGMGGASFNATEALEKGGLVTLQISSPDGKEQISVQGEIVWCESSKAYGVQFAGARAGTLAMIQDWSKGLIKT